MDILATHKSKAMTSIAQIGTMVSVVDFSSLCINMGSIITAITIAYDPSPVLHQFLINFIKITNNTKWACWCESNPGCIANLHWHY
jgi:hypothetical protein